MVPEGSKQKAESSRQKEGVRWRAYECGWLPAVGVHRVHRVHRKRASTKNLCGDPVGKVRPGLMPRRPRRRLSTTKLVLKDVRRKGVGQALLAPHPCGGNIPCDFVGCTERKLIGCLFWPSSENRVCLPAYQRLEHPEHHLKRPDVAAAHAQIAALVPGLAVADLAMFDRRAAGQQGVGEGRAAVVGQRA